MRGEETMKVIDPVAPSAEVTKTEWTCPMHPEIIRDAPGSCPKCGMALEPKTITSEEEENPELIDMTRRFKVSVALTIPLARMSENAIFCLVLTIVYELCFWLTANLCVCYCIIYTSWR